MWNNNFDLGNKYESSVRAQVIIRSHIKIKDEASQQSFCQEYFPITGLLF
jgi:hypothetical protein